MTVALNVYMYSRASLTRSFRPRIRIPFMRAVCACVLAALGAGTIAVGRPQQLSGIKNFGQVTEKLPLAEAITLVWVEAIVLLPLAKGVESGAKRMFVT